MTKPTVHIFYTFDKFGGGANYFLKALRQLFKSQGVYIENPVEADIILFNSHHDIPEVLRLKKKYPHKIFIHRVDGPIFEIRGKQSFIDREIYKINNYIADGTVFQSHYSQEANKSSGMKTNNFETVIINAPAKNEIQNKNTVLEGKIKLINTSNSANWRKGFKIYKYLDEHLDFDKYQMTFIGNSPTTFKNIKWLKRMSHDEMIDQVRQHDIFITASQKDTCSNSLIEALHLGLPAVALNEGGHPEIVGDGGETFENEDDVIAKIETVTKNYANYKSNIRVKNIEQVTDEYYQFFQSIFDNKDYKAKVLKNGEYWFLYLFYSAIMQKVRKLLSIIKND